MQGSDSPSTHPEIAKRRQLLGRVQALLASDPNLAGNLSMCLGIDDIDRIGAELGWEQSEAKMRLRRLIKEGFIDGGDYFGFAEPPFTFIRIEALTDKGLREIRLLPPAESIERIPEALRRLLGDIENNPHLSTAERERKRKSLATTIDGLTETARELGPRVVAEVIWRGMSSW